MARVITWSEDIGPTPDMAWIDLGLLKVDRNYQRDAIPRHIQAIAENFNWRYFQPPTVCPDGNGAYWVVDGQQRTLAAKVHPAVSKVPCYIIDTPMTEEQAKAFIKINCDRRNVTPVTLYWAGLAAGDPKYLAVKRVLDQAGAGVVPGLGQAGPKLTNSVTTIVRAIQSCGEPNAASAIQVLCEAYPTTSNVLRGNLIQALTTLFRDETRIDEDRLTVLLASVNLDILCSDAQNTSRLMGGSSFMALRSEITRRYNKGLRSEQQIRDAA